MQIQDLSFTVSEEEQEQVCMHAIFPSMSRLAAFVIAMHVMYALLLAIHKQLGLSTGQGPRHAVRGFWHQVVSMANRCSALTY